MNNDRKQKLLRFALVSALFVWAGLAYGQLGVFMYKGILFARIMNGRPYVSDFVNVYNGAVLTAKCLRGQKVDIYNINVQNESLKTLIAPVIPEEPFFLQYPPYFFALVLPLSVLPMPAAWLFWNTAGLALSILGLFKLAESVKLDALPDAGTAEAESAGAGRRKSSIFIIAFAFSSYPAWLSLEIGQTSLFLTAAAAFMLYFLKQGKYLQAGLASVILMVKLQYFPFFGLIGLLKGRSRFLAGALGGLSLLTLLSMWMLGMDNVLKYPHALLSGETGRAVSGVSSFMMQNLRGELVLLLKGDGPLVFRTVLIVFALSIFVVLYLFVKRLRDKSAGSFDAVTALSIMIALMASPHTHIQDYVLLSICSLLLWNWLKAGGTAASRLRRKAISKIFMLFPAVSWLFFFLHPVLLLLSIQPFFLCLLVLAGLVLFELETQELKAAS